MTNDTALASPPTQKAYVMQASRHYVLACVLIAAACSSPSTEEAASTTETTTHITTATVTAGDPPSPLVNGDFETGDFQGWTTESFSSGEWYVYEDGTVPPNPLIIDSHVPFDMPDPPQGRYAAATDTNGMGIRFLYRDIEVGGSWNLTATVFYKNQAYDEDFADPGDIGITFGDVWAATGINQQYRIDLVDPAAAIDSLASDDVLAIVFRTQPGDPLTLDPTPVTIDLSPWEGQTIRLRVAQMDNNGPLRAGIDDVRLEQAG
jgi:hypothetical protein